MLYEVNFESKQISKHKFTTVKEKHKSNNETRKEQRLQIERLIEKKTIDYFHSASMTQNFKRPPI